MTIECTLQSIYPDSIIGESINLGRVLYLTMNSNDLARDRISYWVTRVDTNEIIFNFDTSGCVYVYKNVTLTPHEKRMIGKIIRVWCGTYRPDWKTFESMRAHPMSSFADATLVPVMHATL